MKAVNPLKPRSINITEVCLIALLLIVGFQVGNALNLLRSKDSITVVLSDWALPRLEPVLNPLWFDLKGNANVPAELPLLANAFDNALQAWRTQDPSLPEWINTLRLNAIGNYNLNPDTPTEQLIVRQLQIGGMQVPVTFSYSLPSWTWVKVVWMTGLVAIFLFLWYRFWPRAYSKSQMEASKSGLSPFALERLGFDNLKEEDLALITELRKNYNLPDNLIGEVVAEKSQLIRGLLAHDCNINDTLDIAKKIDGAFLKEIELAALASGLPPETLNRLNEKVILDESFNLKLLTDLFTQYELPLDRVIGVVQKNPQLLRALLENGIDGSDCLTITEETDHDEPLVHLTEEEFNWYQFLRKTHNYFPQDAWHWAKRQHSIQLDCNNRFVYLGGIKGRLPPIQFALYQLLAEKAKKEEWLKRPEGEGLHDEKLAEKLISHYQDLPGARASLPKSIAEQLDGNQLNQLLSVLRAEIEKIINDDKLAEGFTWEKQKNKAANSTSYRLYKNEVNIIGIGEHPT